MASYYELNCTHFDHYTSSKPAGSQSSGIFTLEAGLTFSEMGSPKSSESGGLLQSVDSERHLLQSEVTLQESGRTGLLEGGYEPLLSPPFWSIYDARHDEDPSFYDCGTDNIFIRSIINSPQASSEDSWLSDPLSADPTSRNSASSSSFSSSECTPSFIESIDPQTFFVDCDDFCFTATSIEGESESCSRTAGATTTHIVDEDAYLAETASSSGCGSGPSVCSTPSPRAMTPDLKSVHKIPIPNVPPITPIRRSSRLAGADRPMYFDQTWPLDDDGPQETRKRPRRGLAKTSESAAKGLTKKSDQGRYDDGDFQEPAEKRQRPAVESSGSSTKERVRKKASNRNTKTQGKPARAGWRKIIPCPLGSESSCTRTFTRESDLQRHLNTVPHWKKSASEEEEEVYEAYLETGNQRRWCRYCYTLLARADSRKRHEDNPALDIELKALRA